MQPFIYRERVVDQKSNVRGIFTTKFLNHIRSAIEYDKNTDFVVNLHIRRGDVTPEFLDRYLPNSYYTNLIRHIK